MKTKKSVSKQEYGDFQTPLELTEQITKLIKSININPQSIIEPTCGKGNFILSAISTFNKIQSVIGVEINNFYIKDLSKKLKSCKNDYLITLLNKNFFFVDWDKIIEKIPKPFLVIGNPPWITNSDLGSIKSNNLPDKFNFQGYKGLEAKTGKSNFDISEWMLLQYLHWLKKYPGTIAVLCKTSVARKVLNYAWKNNYYIENSSIYKIDTLKYFNASVDACLLIIRSSDREYKKECFYYSSLDRQQCSHTFGYQDSQLIANITLYQKTKHLQGQDSYYQWRSGVKHDRAKIIELIKEENSYFNGNKEKIDIEDTLIYPLLKSSDISKGITDRCRKYLLLTQKYIGQDTQYIQDIAPKTWQYLQNNKHLFAKRASSIYRNRPLFSIFGVGKYTFSPWKVAISSLYKKINFVPLSSIDNKLIILDDTIYFLSCQTQEEAIFLSDILNSPLTYDFFRSMIFWDNKRPITIDLLKRLNLFTLAQKLDRQEEYLFYTKQNFSTLL